MNVAGQNLILVARTSRIYALPVGSSNAAWQFPPKDMSAYPVSAQSRDALAARVEQLGASDADKVSLRRKVDDLHVTGPSVTALKDALKATQVVAGGDAAQFKSDRDGISSAVDSIVTFEKQSLGKIQSWYGEFGISSDSKTAYVASFKGRVFALDLATGQTRWVRDAGGGIVGGIAVASGGAASGAGAGASATPATTAAATAAASPAAGGTAAVPAVSATAANATPTASAGAAASGAGEVLYFGTKSKRFYAVDAAGGDRIWTFDVDGEVWDTPAVAGGRIYFSSLQGSVYALDTAGKQQWRFTGAQSGMGAKPVIADGVVYVGAFDNRFYALDAATGSRKWAFSGANWFWATAAVNGGVVYAANLDGKVYAIDAASGEQRWAFDAKSPVRSSPVLVGGALIVAARDGTLFKIDRSSGSAVDGGSVKIGGIRVLADLSTSADGTTVYVVGNTAQLYDLDVTGPLGAPGSTPLTQ